MRSAGCRRTTTRRAGCCAAWGARSSRWSTTRRRPRPSTGHARWAGLGGAVCLASRRSARHEWMCVAVQAHAAGEANTWVAASCSCWR